MLIMNSKSYIFGEYGFRKWLHAHGENQVSEILDSLKSLNSVLFSQIGKEVKRMLSSSDVQASICEFNPFLWIKKCFMQDDSDQFVDVVKLFSSIIRRVLQKANYDVRIFEMNLEDGSGIEFARIKTGDYPWSDAVDKAYLHFEKFSYIPNRTKVIKWNLAWILYVKYLDEITFFNLKQSILITDEEYCKFDPSIGLRTKVQKDLNEWEEEIGKEYEKKYKREIRKNGETLTPILLGWCSELKSTNIGRSKMEAIEWLDMADYHTIIDKVSPSTTSLRKAIYSFLKKHPILLNQGKHTLMIIFAGNDINLDNLKEELNSLDLPESLKSNVCILRNVSRNGEEIYNIDANYRDIPKN